MDAVALDYFLNLVDQAQQRQRAAGLWPSGPQAVALPPLPPVPDMPPLPDWW